MGNRVSFLFPALPGFLVCCLCGAFGNEAACAASSPSAPGTDAPQAASMSGSTITSYVPFAQESFDAGKALAPATGSAATAQRAIPFRRVPRHEISATPTGDFVTSPALQSNAIPAPAAPAAPPVSNGFAGLADPGNVIPPDTMGAAGLAHLVSALNSGVGVFDKATGTKLSEVTLNGFFASLGTGAGQPANSTFDPKIAYDQYTGRFVIATLGGGASPNSWLLISVSATSDPTGTWFKWAIDADLVNGVQTGNWADYTGLGLDNNNLYLTANMFSNAGVYQYAMVWVIPKSQLLTGSNPVTWFEFPNPPGVTGTLQPVHAYGTSSAGYIIQEGASSSTPPRVSLKIATISSSGGVTVWTDLGHVRVAYYPATAMLPQAPQLGSTHLIDTGDQRLINAVSRNGSIWTTHTVSDNTNAKTEVAWYQIDPAAASPSFPGGAPVQQGRISDPTRFYYYPSTAVNAGGEAGIGFSGSSATEYVGAYYTARAATDTSGTMRGIATLTSGLAPYFKEFGGGGNRWGDYSATCVDPTDDRTFWTLQEYAGTPANTWATWWGSFRLPRSAQIDFDRDGKSDPTVWRTSAGTWYALRSSDGGITAQQWGLGSLSDVPVPGDYDGDGKAEFAVWRPTTGYWYILRSSDNVVVAQQWGLGSLGDTPVPGDYDGDGKTDFAVWRPSSGTWYVLRSSDNVVAAQQWGLGSLEDIPVPGDYDGDGKTDFAIWRPSSGTWYVLRSSDNVVAAQQWGLGSLGDTPVPGDYDGDGKTDFAVWRPSSGTWFVLRSSDGVVVSQPWGLGSFGDVPVPGDYDGDGKTDVAVWRQDTGTWYVLRSSDGSMVSKQWGLGSLTDVPVKNKY